MGTATSVNAAARFPSAMAGISWQQYRMTDTEEGRGECLGMHTGEEMPPGQAMPYKDECQKAITLSHVVVREWDYKKVQERR